MSAGSNVPPDGQPLPVPSTGGGVAPAAAPAKNKTWLWVALGCGGCVVLGGAALVAVIGAGMLFRPTAMTIGGPVAVSGGSEATSWTSAAKSCSETCSRMIACEKKLLRDDPDSGGEVDDPADCEKDCGGNLQDEPYHCLSQAKSCDEQDGCESGD